MKKDLIFAPILLVVAILLALLKATGLPAHIGVAVVGVLVLGAYTSFTKKEWKIPALEIIMRACYGIALVTGIVIMNVQGIAALAIVHKVSAALFAVLLVVLFVYKMVAAKKA
jgi:Na+/glutamate symporter